MTTPRRDPVLWWNVGQEPGDIVVRWRFAVTSVMIHWGNATPREVLGVGEHKFHTYDTVGGYKVRLRQTGGTQGVLAETQIVIRDHKPALTFTTDPDQPDVIVATAPSALDSTGIIPRYRVHWNYFPNPYLYTEFWGMPNASVRQVMPPGTYTARIIDLTTKWWVEQDYTIPDTTLDFSVTATGRDATLTVTDATPGKDLVAAWGGASLVEPVIGTTATHTYRSDVDTTYLVQLVYADDSESTFTTVAIPGGSS